MCRNNIIELVNNFFINVIDQFRFQRELLPLLDNQVRKSLILLHRPNYKDRYSYRRNSIAEFC